MPRISEAKRAAILQDYIAGKLTIVAICRKHDVSDDQPRLIAKAAGVWRSTRAKCVGKPRKKAVVVLKHRPPKIDPAGMGGALARSERTILRRSARIPSVCCIPSDTASHRQATTD